MIIPVFKLFLSDSPLCLLLHVCHVISDPLYLHFEAVQRPCGHVVPLSVSQHVPQGALVFWLPFFQVSVECLLIVKSISLWIFMA